MNDLQKALIEIQAKLKAPKNQYNSFAGFHYRSAEDILEGLKPLLKEYGLFQKVTDEIVNIGTANYVKATVIVRLGDLEETASGWAREEVSLKGQIAAQITGGASSYAKKYALNNMYNIDDTKDPDSQDNSQPKKAQEQTKLVTAIEKQQLKNTMSALGMNEEAMTDTIKDALGKTKVETAGDFHKVVEYLEAL